jgi:hypothetical protein
MEFERLSSLIVFNVLYMPFRALTPQCVDFTKAAYWPEADICADRVFVAGGSSIALASSIASALFPTDFIGIFVFTLEALYQPIDDM